MAPAACETSVNRLTNACVNTHRDTPCILPLDTLRALERGRLFESAANTERHGVVFLDGFQRAAHAAHARQIGMRMIHIERHARRRVRAEREEKMWRCHGASTTTRRAPQEKLEE